MQYPDLETYKELFADRFGDLIGCRFDGLTALVAEDEPDLLSLVTGMLEDLGMRVLSAKDGHEALAVQDEYKDRIDLLLTDVVMPELNGVDLADLLGALRPDMKTIFMSGYPARKDTPLMNVPPSAVFIPKPIKRENLIQLIHAKLFLDDEAVGQPHWSSKNGDSTKRETA